MVKKVKRFIVFVLFSFFYSFLFGKSANAQIIDVIAQEDGMVMGTDGKTNISVDSVDEDDITPVSSADSGY